MAEKIIKRRALLQHMRSSATLRASAASIDIFLDQFVKESVSKSFATGEDIAGVVKIEVARDTPFSAVIIAFEGKEFASFAVRVLVLKYSNAFVVSSSRTSIDGTLGCATTLVKKRSLTPSSSKSGTETRHTFLRTVQPDSKSCLPQKSPFKAQTPCVLPFRFTVPKDLPPQACIQQDIEDHVRERHLALPPSLGEQSGSEWQEVTVLNTAPNVCNITYHIKVKVVGDDGLTVLGEASRRVNIRPVVRKEFAIRVSDTVGKECVSSSSAYFEKTKWAGHLGKLTVEVAQPRSLCVPVSTGYDSCPITSVETTATLNLSFEPVEVNGRPPSMNRLVARLRAATLIASQHIQECPFRVGVDRADGTQDGLSVESVTLLDRSVGDVAWQRAGHHSSHSLPTSLDRIGRKQFTASIAAPLTLPLDPSASANLATFHSCLVSRFYVLSLQLSLQSPGNSISPSKKALRVEVPLQVSSKLFVNETTCWSDDDDDDSADE